MQTPSATARNGNSRRSTRTITSHDTLEHQQTNVLIRGVTPDNMPSTDTSSRRHHSLDWLTYTVPSTVGWKDAFPASRVLCATGEVLSNIRGYDTRFGLTHGSVSFHTRCPHHKICVQFSGRDLRLLGEAGVYPRDLLTYALGHDGRITRLDFALDVFEPSSPKDLHDAWEEGRLKTPAHFCDFMFRSERAKGEVEKTYSTYIGSETSERRIRCYDKAAQMRETGPWTRIEFIARKAVGNQLAAAMLETDMGTAGKQAIRDFVQCDIDWFNQAVTGQSVYIAPPSHQERDTRRWLNEQVLPVLCRIVAEDAAVGDVSIREVFLSALLPRAGIG